MNIIDTKLNAAASLMFMSVMDNDGVLYLKDNLGRNFKAQYVGCGLFIDDEQQLGDMETVLDSLLLTIDNNDVADLLLNYRDRVDWELSFRNAIRLVNISHHLAAGGDVELVHSV